MDQLIEIREYDNQYETRLITFLEECFPESGRVLDLEGKHNCYKQIDTFYLSFWCMFHHEKIIGVVGVRKIEDEKCELKSLFLLEKYHRRGYGNQLLQKAITYAREQGYKEMYLDAFSRSDNAIALYRKTGFVDTKRYNQNYNADVFMKLNLN